MMKKNLTNKEKERYNRHFILEDLGEAGQQKLKNAKVLIVGVGGLGSPLSLYLTAVGIGEIGLMDDDVVSESNLQRQVLYNTAEVGMSKVEVAGKKLSALNPYTRFNLYSCRLTVENALEMIKDYDIVMDGCDNLYTRYIINDACVKLDKVYVYGAIQEFSGQVSVFNYNGGPTYRCFLPYNESRKTFTQPLGVLGVLPGITATIQANEAIKVITGLGAPLAGKVLLIDTLDTDFEKIEFERVDGYDRDLLV